jgi:1,3-beta-glucanosyltransferase GAS1
VYSLRSDDKPGIHSVCMKALSEAGIYVIVGLFGPEYGIGRFQNWDYVMQSRQAAILDSLSEFPNLLGAVVDGTPITLPFVKGAVKDLRNRFVDRNVRQVPIGYLGWDFSEDIGGDFLVCGNREESIDFQMVFVNPTKFCGAKLDEREANYKDVLSQRSAYPVPLILGQLECPSQEQEDFATFRQLYNGNLTNVHSGMIMFSYFDENDTNWTVKGQFFYSDFFELFILNKATGLVEVTGLSIKPRPVYSALRDQLSAFQPSMTAMADYKPTNSFPSSCNSRVQFELDQKNAVGPTTVILATNLPPTPNYNLCQCMMAQLDCVSNPVGDPEYAEPKLLYALDINYAKEKEIAGKVCGQNQTLCQETRVNTTTGEYGPFSGCNSTERSSWMLNQSYLHQNRSENTCQAFGKVVKTPEPPRTSGCEALLRQAGYTGPLNSTRLNASTTLRGSRNRGLSTAASLGLAIALTVLAIGIGGLFVWLCRRKHIQRNRAHDSLYGKGEFRKLELPADPIVANKSDRTVMEIGGNEVREIEDSSHVQINREEVQEMPTIHNDPVELEGTSGRLGQLQSVARQDK